MAISVPFSRSLLRRLSCEEFIAAAHRPNRRARCFLQGMYRLLLLALVLPLLDVADVGHASGSGFDYDERPAADAGFAGVGYRRLYSRR